MPEVGRLYGEVRGRITELAREAGPEAAERTVPPCPDWTIKDVIAHLSGVCADILGGRLDGVATDPWTARQVIERRERSLDEVLDEWSEVAPKCEEIAEHFGDAGVQWVADVTAHEHDIRCALGLPGQRDSEAVAVAFPWLADALVSQGFKPAFRVVTPEGDDLTVGEGDPEATVKVGRFEMLRALTGRRSEEQIAAFDWDADYKRYLGAFSRGPFRVAASPIVE